MGKGKIGKSLLIALVSGFSLLALVAPSLAWFLTTITISEINGLGTTEPAYFAYGTGTAEHPYGISDTRHLNNLAWLQYNGTFDDGNYHFELASDINAGGEIFVIPPIGTEGHPFKGVFDGNGHTVNNIKVTNDSSSFSNKPRNITYSQLEAEIVGFFGVVGNLSGESYSSSVNNLTDFTLKNIEVESKTSQTLIGLAAGYVNAEMSGVKIDGTATIDLNGQASTAKTAYTDKLTDYGLVGYSTKVGSSGTYRQNLSKYFNNSNGGGDDGNNFGGSIDMESLFKRLSTVKTEMYTYYDGGSSKVNGYDYAGKYSLIDRDDGPDYHYLSGGNTSGSTTYTQGTQKELDTITYTSEGNDNAFYISCAHNGETYYLNLNSNGTAIETSTTPSTYWRISGGRSDSSHDGFVYTLANIDFTVGFSNTTRRNVARFLAVNSNTLSISIYPDASSRWELSGNDLYAYGTTKFISYDGATWALHNSTEVKYYKLKRYNTDYYVGINEDTKTIVADKSRSEATNWNVVNYLTNGFRLTTEIGSDIYKVYVRSTTSYRFELQLNSQYTFASYSNNTGGSLSNRVRPPTDGSFLGESASNSTSNYAYYSNGSIFLKKSSSISSTNYITFDVTTATISKSVLSNQTSLPGLDWVANKTQIQHSEGYIPINVSNGSLAAKESNVGYICSGSNYYVEKKYLGDIRVSRYGYSNLSESVSPSSNDITFYTINSSGKHEINDTLTNQDTATAKSTIESLGFTRYYDYTNSYGNVVAGARDRFYETLTNNRDSVFGLHFMDAEVSASNKFTASNLIINGQQYASRQMPRDCIDFVTTKDDGVITFFAGTYFGLDDPSDLNNVFFSLKEVERDKNTGNITSINNISRIYRSASTQEIYYASTKRDPSDALLFDTDWITNPDTNFQTQSIYYFEIPIKAGEYALGSTTGNGAYLMYLDIGSNGEEQKKDTVSAYTITTVKSSNSYPIGVDFAPINVSGDGGETIAIFIAASKQGVLQFTIESNDITVTDSASISAYSYRNSDNYVSSSPSASQFTCNLSGTPPAPPSGGTRVLNIKLATLSEDEYSIRITDVLSDAGGTISSSSYELDSGSGFVSSSLSEIEALSEQIDLDALRSLPLAVTLTRTAGSGEFSTVYDIDNCDATTLDVDIETNGTTISIDVEDGYTFKVGGVAYADGSTYSVA